jgi:hypothetical protein
MRNARIEIDDECSQNYCRPDAIAAEEDGG